MKNIQEILQERAEKIHEARAILDDAKGAGREVTTAEKKKFDALMAQADELKLAADEADLNRPRGRVTDFQTASSPHCVKSGDFRLLKNSEKLADVYPVRNADKDIDLGKMVMLASGGPRPDRCEKEVKALAGNTGAGGGFTVPDGVSQEIFDLARNQARVFQAGAMTYLMKHPKELLPKLTADPTGEWKPENNEHSTTDATAFGGVELQSRTLMFWLPISRELWSDAGNLGAFLTSAIATAAANELDRCALVGTGIGDQPRGLYYDADVTKTAAVGVLDMDEISDSIYRVENANHEARNIILSAFVMNRLRKLKDGEGNYLLPKTPWVPPLLPTNQIPNTLGAGSNESFLVTGDFRNLIVGIRQDLQIEVLREVKAKNYQVVIMAAMRADVAAIRPAAFDIINQITS